MFGRTALSCCLWIQVLATTASSSTTTATTKIISESNARLPMSLSTIITDLEAEGVSEITTACLIGSRSVTQLQRQELLEKMFGGDDEEEEGSSPSFLLSLRAFGTDNGLAIAQPPSAANAGVYEVASTAIACGGNVVYYPSPEDLSRGEGLFESLAPAMERILSAKKKKNNDEIFATLVVVVDEDADGETRSKLEKACEAVLANFVQPREHNSGDETATTTEASLLEDVFDSVVFVRPADVVPTLKEAVHDKSYKSPSEAAARIADCASSDLLSTIPPSATTTGAAFVSAELAAARTIGPIARKAVSAAIQTVRDATTGGGDTATQLVSNFGSLCDAAIAQAFEELETTSSQQRQLLSTTSIGKQIKANLENELHEELGRLFDRQLEQLLLASFDDFKQGLSKLRVSPNLENDMDGVISKSVAGFAAKAKQLQMSGKGKKKTTVFRLPPWPFHHAAQKFQKQLREYCKDRLLAARASGQYKPLPRKGFQVGFHWLLPKPFGNDYRQEPWMVHATDNMVYIPGDKVTDVSPADVPTTGDYADGGGSDWRTKIVPSPAGSDMIYVQ